MSKNSISYDEWMKEMAAAGIRDDSTTEGITTMELADAFGRGLDWARRVIRKNIKDGTAKFIGFKTTMTMDGRRCRTPSYLFKKAGRKR